MRRFERRHQGAIPCVETILLYGSRTGQASRDSLLMRSGWYFRPGEHALRLPPVFARIAQESEQPTDNRQTEVRILVWAPFVNCRASVESDVSAL